MLLLRRLVEDSLGSARIDGESLDKDNHHAAVWINIHSLTKGRNN